MTILSSIQSPPKKSTRTVRINLLYTFNGDRPGSEWVEAFMVGTDDLWPRQVVAYSWDPTVQDTLKIALVQNHHVVVDIEDSDHGPQITGIEEQR